MKKLQKKVSLIIVLITVLLFVSGTISVISFRVITNTASKLVENNYKSVLYAQEMNSAVERIKYGALLIKLDTNLKGDSIIKVAHDSFMNAYNKAWHNITEPFEKECLQKILSNYSIFSEDIRGFNSSKFHSGYTGEGINDLSSYLKMRNEINRLLLMNRKKLQSHFVYIKSVSSEKFIPGLIAITIAIALSIYVNIQIARRIWI